MYVKNIAAKFPRGFADLKTSERRKASFLVHCIHAFVTNIILQNHKYNTTKICISILMHGFPKLK